MSGRILEAQELERRRVSRELHDGVNQILSATKFGLHSVERQLRNDDEGLREKTAHVKQLIEKAIAEVRMISRNLHPSELDDIGLLAAMRTLIGEFCVRTGVQVIFFEPPKWKKLSPKVRLTIYRILQEALANIEKHSEATRVTVILQKEKDSLVMMIRDNGKGFHLKAAQRKAGLGLDNMRERATFVNGSMDVKSVVGRGTELMLRLPF
jgi:two-component system NarL family sensor kinase